MYTANNGTPTNGWSVEGNLAIVSSTPFSVTVTTTGNGAGKVLATFQNGQKTTKDVWVGKPIFGITVAGPDSSHTFATIGSGDNTISIENQGITSVQMTRTSTSGAVTTLIPSGSTIFTARINPQTTRSVTAVLTNACGTTFYTEFLIEMLRTAQPSTVQFYTVFPNPTSSVINISLRNTTNLPTKTNKIEANLFDMVGIQKATVDVVDNTAKIDVSGLAKGLYILKIDVDGMIETHHFAIE